MTLTEFKNLFDSIAGDISYVVFYGSMSSYNSTREINDKQIVVEPFKNVTLDNSKSCYTDLDITLWLLNKRDRNTNQTESDLSFEDTMRDDANQLYDLIQASSRILVKQKKQNIETNYYESDSNSRVSNNQSLLSLTLELRLY